MQQKPGNHQNHGQNNQIKRMEYADDDRFTVRHLARMRMPSLGIGLLLGLILSFVTSRFEEVLATDVKIAFFIPFIVYMAAAVGSQTQNIFARDLRSGRAGFKHYLVKETSLGIIFGAAASGASALIVSLWFGSAELAFAVSLSMFCAVAIAPLVALLVTEFLQLEHTDPAVGSGPIATIIQDTLSVIIYGLIASWVIL
jgi:magnesium transporter